MKSIINNINKKNKYPLPPKKYYQTMEKNIYYVFDEGKYYFYKKKPFINITFNNLNDAINYRDVWYFIRFQ